MTDSSLTPSSVDGYDWMGETGIAWGTIGKYRFRCDIPDEPDLYFIIDSNRCCKIGRSKDVDKRLSSLQVSHPHKLVLLMQLPRMGWQESVWHHAFQHVALRGEWHRGCPELWGCIEAAWKGDDWATKAVGPSGCISWTDYVREMEADAHSRAMGRYLSRQMAICDPSVIPDCRLSLNEGGGNG